MSPLKCALYEVVITIKWKEGTVLFPPTWSVWIDDAGFYVTNLQNQDWFSLVLVGDVRFAKKISLDNLKEYLKS